MTRSNVLVTGATGLIGATLVAHLRDRQRTVATLGRINANPGAEPAEEVRRLTATVDRPDWVVHLAACVPSATRPDSESAHATTRLIDRVLMGAVEQWQCRVIYASGCSLYLNRRYDPTCESDELDPDPPSPYLRSKAAGDAEFSSYEPATVVRISCPVGPRVSAASVIGRFMSQLEVAGAIHVYGTGSREQDFVDVRDIAASIERVIATGTAGVFNIASGTPTTMRELAETIVAVCGAGRVITGEQADPLEGVTARYSTVRAAQTLGWQPKYDLRTSLQRLWAAIRERATAPEICDDR